MFGFLRRSAWLAALVIGAPAAIAQTAANYPNKPVRVILPFPPGGSTNIVTSIYAKKLNEDWGQPIIVDNRPGGNTLIGSEAMVRSTPDGYTLLGVTSSHIINPWLQPKLPYDTFRDFAPISTLTRADFMIAVNPNVPAGNLKELIAYAKSNPGKANFGTVNLGSVQHLAIELFMDTTGTKFTVVPYKGGAPLNADLVSGVLQVIFNNPASMSPFLKSGKMKGIAVSGDNRKAALPDVPTFAEAGLPGFAGVNWMALLAPAATPKDIVQKINANIARAQASNDVRELLVNQAIEPYPLSVAATEAMMRADYERYGRIIREKNIKSDETD